MAFQITPTSNIFRTVVKSDTVDVEMINGHWPSALQCGEAGIVQVVSEDGRIVPFTVAAGQIASGDLSARQFRLNGRNALCGPLPDVIMRPEQVPARPECPEPARWWAPDSDATEIDVTNLIGAFITALKPDFVIETGSYHGDTTEVIGEALQALRHGWLMSLELDPAFAQLTRQRVEGLPVSVIVGPASEFIPSQPIDVLFIDCETKGRLKQLQHFQPYASPRCVILMHDSALPKLSDVIAELYDVMEQSEASGLVQPWVKLPTPRGLAITRYA